jgi:hypothetical protein
MNTYHRPMNTYQRPGALQATSKSFLIDLEISGPTTTGQSPAMPTTGRLALTAEATVRFSPSPKGYVTPLEPANQ